MVSDARIILDDLIGVGIKATDGGDVDPRFQSPRNQAGDGAQLLGQPVVVGVVGQAIARIGGIGNDRGVGIGLEDRLADKVQLLA